MWEIPCTYMYVTSEGSLFAVFYTINSSQLIVSLIKQLSMVILHNYTNLFIIRLFIIWYFFSSKFLPNYQLLQPRYFVKTTLVLYLLMTCIKTNNTLMPSVGCWFGVATKWLETKQSSHKSSPWVMMSYGYFAEARNWVFSNDCLNSVCAQSELNIHINWTHIEMSFTNCCFRSSWSLNRE